MSENGLKDVYTALQNFYVKAASMEYKERQLQQTEIHTFDSDLRKLKNYMLTSICILSHRIGVQPIRTSFNCMSELDSLPMYQTKAVLIMKFLKIFLKDLNSVWI